MKAKVVYNNMGVNMEAPQAKKNPKIAPKLAKIAQKSPKIEIFGGIFPISPPFFLFFMVLINPLVDI